jgi:hypothetical protein
VTKTATAATSLVAALPAAFLAYLGVMAFLQHADAMPMMLQVVTGLTLLIAVLMFLSPFAVLLFMRGAKAAPEAEVGAATAATPAAAAAVAAAPIAAEAGSEEALEFDDELAAEPASDLELEAPSSDLDLEATGSEDELTAEPASDDAFEFDDEDFQFDDEEFK